MPQERRKFTRIFKSEAVVLEIGNLILRGTECRNIGMGGLCVNVTGDVKKNQLGTVTLTCVCNDETISLHMGFSIAWVRSGADDETLVGMSFVNPTPADLLSLTKIIDFLIAQDSIV
jgi:hypothetical protein